MNWGTSNQPLPISIDTPIEGQPIESASIFSESGEPHAKWLMAPDKNRVASMHKIEKIKVAGFWGVHSFEVNLFPDVTFFIGVNGTGKTTFINLIAAALCGDLTTPERLPFTSLEIVLTAGSNNKRPSISVTKKKSKNRPFDEIQYRIGGSQSSDEKVFS